MTPLFQLALSIGLCLASAAVAAPPVYQLRAAQDLVGIGAGGPLDVRVEAQAAAGAEALERAALTDWALVIAPCTALDDGSARIVPQAAHGGRFRLTVPAARSAHDPHMCVARWAGEAIADDPLRLRFCVGDLTLRECHPGWWDAHCRGVPAAECDARAIAAGVKAGGDISGLIYVERGGRRKKVSWTSGSGCPVQSKPWGVVFTRKGRLMALDIAGMEAAAVLDPPAGVVYRSPWPDGAGGLLLVADSSTGRRLLRAPAACAGPAGCALEPIRGLPGAVGRIVGRADGAVLMTHRLSTHAVRVPLDPQRPAAQLAIAAPPAACAVEVDGARVTNDGAPPAGW